MILSDRDALHFYHSVVALSVNMVNNVSLSCVQYEEVADKDDLMGVEDTAKKGML